MEPPPGRRHLDPQTLGKTMGPIQWRALASPPKRWVSLRAGCWKGFVFGKHLQTSGDWAGKHPFKAGESQKSGTRLLGYCLPYLCMAGTEGKVGQERHTGSSSSVSLLFFSVLRLTVPHHLFPDTHLSYLLSYAFYLITKCHCSGSEEHSKSPSSTVLFTWTAADAYFSIKFCLLSLQCKSL